MEELRRNCDELRRTCRNQESPNADLRCKKENAYSHRSSAESRRRSLDRFRSMQWPKSTEVRCSLTAAELERQWGLREEEDEEEKNEKDQGVPIYKGLSEQEGAKIEEDPNNDYPTKRTPQFSEGIKE